MQAAQANDLLTVLDDKDITSALFSFPEEASDEIMCAALWIRMRKVCGRRNGEIRHEPLNGVSMFKRQPVHARSLEGHRLSVG
jgi:hypothetical protein